MSPKPENPEGRTSDHGGGDTIMRPVLRQIEPVIALVALAFVVIGCFVVLRPFITSLLLAAILAYSSWPAFQYLERRTGLGHGFSAFLMAVILALALIVPFLFIGNSLAENVVQFIEVTEDLMQAGLPPPPAWLMAIPLLGESLTSSWQNAAAGGTGFADAMEPYLEPIRDLALSGGISIGRGILELSLSLIVSFFFYRDGEAAAMRVARFNKRIFSHRAEKLQNVVSGTVRSVVYGVLGTALIQGLIASFGYHAAGLPAPYFLGFVTFLLALLPIGPPFIWVPAVAWLIVQGFYPSAIFLGIYGFFVISGIDNIVKPYLISKGSDLPLIVVFLGLFGGIAAFGFLGIFLGPTLLALGFALAREMSTPVQEAGAAKQAEAKIDGSSDRA